jgi:hypothetical protein
MAATVRITINEDLGRVLESLKGEYPTLDYTELFKLGLSELYHKRELDSRKRWAESLPTLKLSKKEQAELDKALDEADKSPGKPLSLSQLKKELKATKR